MKHQHNNGIVHLGVIFGLLAVILFTTTLATTLSLVKNRQRLLVAFPEAKQNESSKIIEGRVLLLGRVSSQDSWNSNGISGQAPLTGVDLLAKVGIRGPGLIRYRFDCESNGQYEHEKITLFTTYSVKDICDYKNEGLYQALVRVEWRENQAATDTLSVKVEGIAPSVTPPITSFSNTLGIQDLRSSNMINKVWQNINLIFRGLFTR